MRYGFDSRRRDQLFEVNGMNYTNAFLAELEDNIADEAIARQKYYSLLEKYGDELSAAEKCKIEEIISEELKHSDTLAGMIWRRNHIIAEK